MKLHVVKKSLTVDTQMRSQLVGLHGIFVAKISWPNPGAPEFGQSTRFLLFFSATPIPMHSHAEFIFDPGSTQAFKSILNFFGF